LNGGQVAVESQSNRGFVSVVNGNDTEMTLNSVTRLTYSVVADRGSKRRRDDGPIVAG